MGRRAEASLVEQQATHPGLAASNKTYLGGFINDHWMLCPALFSKDDVGFAWEVALFSKPVATFTSFAEAPMLRLAI